MIDSRSLKAAIAYGELNQAEVARAIGMSPQQFGQKLSRNTFTEEQLFLIAKSLGAEFHPAEIVFTDGKRF